MKRKRGRHSLHLDSMVREAIAKLEELDNVSRVIVGYTKGGISSSHAKGFVKLQRLAATGLYAVVYGGRHLVEVTIIPKTVADMPGIADKIVKQWPQLWL